MPELSAFQYALRLLGYRSRSTAELKMKLYQKGFADGDAEAALQKLERLGYINDSALAEALARQAREARKLGRKGAEGLLLKRGIPAGLALDALAGYDEFQGAEAVARKKLRGMRETDPASRRRRLYGCLARRGYSAETIRKIFSLLKEEDI